jgi:hypothetical protein
MAPRNAGSGLSAKPSQPHLLNPQKWQIRHPSSKLTTCPLKCFLGNLCEV